MGFRFRKSKKILPGVKVNFSKRGMGVSFGGKNARYSISPTGRRTTSFKVAPGLTYTTSSGGRKRQSKRRSAPQTGYAYTEPRKQVKPSNAAAVIFSFLSFFLLWIFGIELSWNATLLKVISILIAVLFVIFMLVNNIESLKNKILDITGLNKKQKTELLQLQKILIENSPDELLYSKNELLQTAQSEASNCLRIFKDSILIIVKTADPDTFFSRYDLLLKQAERIDILSDYVKFNGVEPKSVYQEALNDKQKQIYQMINRYWSETIKGADSLKTDNGKKNRYQKFYDTLERYKNEISEENIIYYTAKYRSALFCLK